MSKRKRFVATSIGLSLGFIAISWLDNQVRYWFITLLSLLSVGLYYWSLREGLGLKMTLITLILPFLFTLGVGLFWFLLPSSIFTRIPVVVFYALGVYILCLTMNIFTVAAIRTIALLRAARGVGFVFSLVISFLIFDAMMSFKMALWWLALLVAFFSFLVFVQGLWSITLEEAVSSRLLITSLVFSLVMVEISAILFFWPVTVVVGSLFLTAAIYLLLGLGQARFEGRLFVQTVREYLTVGVFVFIGMLVATSWR